VNFLNAEDMNFIKGVEFAFERISVLFESNLDTYKDELNEMLENGDIPLPNTTYAKTPGLYHVLREDGELIVDMIADWLSRERSELVTSMIDGMDDEEYKSIRDKYLANNPDVDFYDTRDFKEISKRAAENKDV
jgi:hypothetical protein